MSFDSTVKGISATSYIPVADADAFFADHPHNTSWSGLANEQKQIRLMEATRRLEQENFLGAMTTITQALQWPRLGVADPQKGSLESSWFYGPIMLDPDTIPRQMVAATCELAIAFELGLIPSATSAIPAGIKSASLFNLSVTTDGSMTTGFPPNVQRYLRGLIQTDDGTVRLVRS